MHRDKIMLAFAEVELGLREFLPLGRPGVLEPLRAPSVVSAQRRLLSKYHVRHDPRGVHIGLPA